MGRHASNVSGRCSKSQREIAATFGISHDTVQRYVAKLEDCGLIKRQVVPGKESVYVLLAVEKKRSDSLSEKGTDLPLTASSNHSGKGTPIALTPTPSAATPTPRAARNKEVRLIQDSIKTKPSGAVAPATPDPKPHPRGSTSASSKLSAAHGARPGPVGRPRRQRRWRRGWPRIPKSSSSRSARWWATTTNRRRGWDALPPVDSRAHALLGKRPAEPVRHAAGRRQAMAARSRACDRRPELEHRRMTRSERDKVREKRRPRRPASSSGACDRSRAVTEAAPRAVPARRGSR
jgi:biotin operon repressor